MPPTLDPRVDAYIAKAPAFARPILEKVRKAFHRGCPQLVETIRWSAPHFDHHGILGSMSAFKAHVSFGFWRGGEIGDPAGILTGIGNTKMAALKVGQVKDLPAQGVLVEYVQRAAEANLTSRAEPKKKAARPAPATPADLTAALKRNARARRTYEAFPPSKRRDYVEWISQAKRPETRDRRLRQAVEWMAEGKARNWKYESC